LGYNGKKFRIWGKLPCFDSGAGNPVTQRQNRKGNVGLNENMIGLAIRKCRKKQGLTLEDFSAIVGIGISYLSKIERGLSVLRVTTFCRIAQGLGIAPHELMQLAEKEQA